LFGAATKQKHKQSTRAACSSVCAGPPQAMSKPKPQAPDDDMMLSSGSESDSEHQAPAQPSAAQPAAAQAAQASTLPPNEPIVWSWTGWDVPAGMAKARGEYLEKLKKDAKQ
jgi:hypothetical protein